MKKRSPRSCGVESARSSGQGFPRSETALGDGYVPVSALLDCAASARPDAAAQREADALAARCLSYCGPPAELQLMTQDQSRWL